jgi:hypothetical protein
MTTETQWQHTTEQLLDSAIRQVQDGIGGTADARISYFSTRASGIEIAVEALRLRAANKLHEVCALADAHNDDVAHRAQAYVLAEDVHKAAVEMSNAFTVAASRKEPGSVYLALTMTLTQMERLATSLQELAAYYAAYPEWQDETGG